MCDTCGCEDSENVKIYEPGKIKEHHHHHSHDKAVPNHHHHSHDNAVPHHHHHDKHSHRKISVEQDILSKNNLLSERNRGYFEALGIFAINMVSSPGSGKTSVIERTIAEIGGQLKFYVIEGDQQTSNDAERIQKAGAKAVQVNTGNGCHLDANMVNNATKQLEPESNSVLIIENVGNLVCPSMFDLGEKKRVAIFSVTEGEDKPEKYPTIFHTSDVCILNKTDLLPYVDFDIEKAKNLAKQLNPDMVFFEVSAKTGEGMEKWYEWLNLANS
ncbi:MAG: hydrogenase nickel incorporation protein HypB [Prolixibacteraceae bacterium]|jgi:hydrogenase nickel incorporation protein HypB|nr:hydrogenase nickel incorporation protein HypB [Prolixibacteraceae bacterium]MBT6767108.1 hydrogenase nickel incorporation protein HypB [Prolixibacteraceae bacterium]MBT6999661.1 hydrogenase nickel incorporation protein HypB [Prolixibacteraceae bacterium]MBT7394998.1 hydrogenase nickel incorporation protein HypB [Prolixibacteraceae bacterium]